MKKTIIAVVISGTTALGLALSSSIAFAQSTDASSTAPATTGSSNQQSTTGQLSQDVKQGWDKTKEKATDVKNDVKNKYDEEKAKHDDSASSTSTMPANNNTMNTNNDNTTTNVNQTHADGKTVKTSQSTTHHNYVRKTHYKHQNYRVHHDINWSADQHMARTGYEAPPKGWNGLGRPKDIPQGDNPKWYNVNYGYSTEEVNDHTWHHHHHHKEHHHNDTDNDNMNMNNNQ